jgi:hypothetical protein
MQLGFSAVAQKRDGVRPSGSIRQIYAPFTKCVQIIFIKAGRLGIPKAQLSLLFPYSPVISVTIRKRLMERERGAGVCSMAQDTGL